MNLPEKILEEELYVFKFLKDSRTINLEGVDNNIKLYEHKFCIKLPKFEQTKKQDNYYFVELSTKRQIKLTLNKTKNNYKSVVSDASTGEELNCIKYNYYNKMCETIWHPLNIGSVEGRIAFHLNNVKMPGDNSLDLNRVIMAEKRLQNELNLFYKVEVEKKEQLRSELLK